MSDAANQTCHPPDPDPDRPPSQDPELHALLAAGASNAAAAAFAKVHPRTISRWRRRAEFAQAVRDARAEIYEQTCGLLSDSSADAVRVLTAIAKDPEEPSSVRIMACSALLRLGADYRKMLDLETEFREFKALVEADAAARGQPLAGGGG